MRVNCAWFLLCKRAATTVREHPVLGAVPICAACDAKVARLDGAAKKKKRPLDNASGSMGR